MALTFKRATTAGVKVRVALAGPPGSGKTLGALLLAAGIRDPGARVAVIDTERERSRNHADYLLAEHGLEYELAELVQCDVEGYDAALKDAYAHVGPDGVVIVDSLSHEWTAMLAEVDRLKGRGVNNFAAWNGPSQKHSAFVDRLMRSPCHLIVTMRSKVDYALDGGKVQKLGLAPVQREGIEYEWDVALDVDQTSACAVSKCNVATLRRPLEAALVAETGRKIHPRVGAVIRAWRQAHPAPAAPVAASGPTHTFAPSEVAELAAPSASSPVSPAGPQGHAAAPPAPSHGDDLAAEARYQEGVAAARTTAADARAEAGFVHELSARALARCGFDKARYDAEVLAAVAPETIKAVKADGKKRREAARKKVRAAWVAAGVAAERVERWSQAIVEADAPTGREVTAFLAAVETVAAAQEVTA